MSAFLTGIRVRNWKRFRGTFELELGPGTYAIVAEDEEDSDRSNWLGKSAIVEAVRFAMTGKASSDDGTLDGLISHGEAEMAVDLEFSDSTFVSKSKERGKSVQTFAAVQELAGELEAHQAAAQEAIHEWLCLSAEDFDSTVYIGQKEARRFVDTDPADRTRLINGWLALSPLEVAAARADRRVAALVEEDRKLNEVEDRARGEAERHDAEGMVQVVRGLELEVEEEREALEAARARWRKAHESVEDRAKALMDKQQADAHARTLLELEAAKKAALGLKVVPTKRSEELLAGQRAAIEDCRRRVVKKRRLAAGDFDGQCPLMHAPCPASDEVLEKTKGNRRMLESAESSLAVAEQETAKTERALAQLRRDNREAETKIERERRLKAEAERLRPAAERHRRCREEIPEEPPAEPSDRALVLAEQALERALELCRELDAARERRAELARELGAWRAACAILGRQGAQRRISRSVLAQIEQGANGLLSRAGIPLQVRAEWGRPTQQMEDQCSRCGAPFPKSRKARQCEACGSDRGRKLDGKLHVATSSRSGATEDLGGVGFQLAAAAWLRRRRGSPLSTVFLDEPFGALDPHNRRGLAQALARVADIGFEQSFVIAHDRGILDALPRRIQVIGRGKWSEVRVV